MFVFKKNMRVNIISYTTPNISYTVPNERKSAYSTDNVKSIPAHYYMPVHFKGRDMEIITKELMDLENIHCPHCNVKTISQKQFEKIQEEINKVKTSVDFIEFLDKYRENIIPQYRKTENFCRQIIQSQPDIQLEDMLKKLASGANSLLKKDMSNYIRFLKEYINKNSCENSEKFYMEEFMKQCGEFLKNQKSPSVRDFKTILAATLANLKQETKNDIYPYITDKIYSSFSYRNLFKFNPLIYSPETTPVSVMLKNIMSNSVSNIANINDNFFSYFDSITNQVITCKNCKENAGKIITELREGNKSTEKACENYVNDLANAINNNKLTYGKDYVFIINKRLRSLYRDKNQINNTPEELLKIKEKDFYKIRKDMDFKLVNYRDINCAGCGNPIMVHEDAEKITERIKNCKNTAQIYEIMDELDCDNLIRPVLKPVLKRMKKLVNQNPNISAKEVLDDLRNKSWEHINQQLRTCINSIQKVLNDKTISPKEKFALIKYIDLLQNQFISSDYTKIFSYNDYALYTKRTLKNITTPELKNILQQTKDDIRIKFVPQTLYYSFKNDNLSYDEQMKHIFTQFTKNSVATIDHLIAKDLKGENNKENLIVLCRNCNKEKTNMPIDKWLNMREDIRENLQKYVYNADKIIHREQLTDYYDYAPKLVKHLNESAGEDFLEYNPE